MGLLPRIGYIRVSTAKGEQLGALENQRARVAATGVAEILQDVQSGTDSDRAGYLELLSRIELRKVSEVVITRVDRLGRDAADVDAAIAFAAKRGVKITAIDGGTIESETPQGFVMSRIMTTMAEMESRMLSQRIHAGLREGRKRHRPLRGRAPWGYQVNAQRDALEPEPVQWPRAETFLDTLRSTQWRMSTALDKWAAEGRGALPLNSSRAVRAWLVNPVIRGGLGYHQQKNHTYREVVWDTHPALLSHEEYEGVTYQLEENRRMWGHNSDVVPRLLTSLCQCGECHKGMSYAGGRTIRSLICKTRNCPQQYKSTHESVIRDCVLAELARRAQDLANLITEEPPEAQLLRDSIQSLEALSDPDLEDAIKAKRYKLQQLHHQKPVNLQVINALCRPTTLAQLDPEELRLLFQQLVKCIEVKSQAVSRIQLQM